MPVNRACDETGKLNLQYTKDGQNICTAYILRYQG